MSCVNQVMFLCTGNYYRSRFAEIIFNHHAEENALGWRAISRGLNISFPNPGPISIHTRLRLQERGIPLDADIRYPVAADDSDFESSQHIIAVKESEHRPLVDSNFPLFRYQVEYWNVHDLDCSGPGETLDQLEVHVESLIKQFSLLVR